MQKDEAELIAEKIKAADTTGTFTSMKLKSINVSAVIHRHATGKDEHIGLAYYHRNPIKHYYVNFMMWLRGIYRLWRQFLLTKVKK